MRLAYIVLAHRLPEQVVRLVRTLLGDGVVVFLHISRRTPEPVRETIAEGVAGAGDVRLLPRHDIRWGGFSLVTAMMEGVAAVARLRRSPDYTMVLTGQDYPIKPQLHIKRVLDGAQGVSFMEALALPSDNWPRGGMDRLQAWHWPYTVPRLGHVSVPNRYLPLPVRRRVPLGYRPWGGSMFWCLSREALCYLHAFVRANPDFARFFRRVHVPDEFFVHTILMNSPLAGDVVTDDLRYIDWSAGGPSPKVLTMDDWPALQAAPDLWARKFDVERDARVLDAIDGRITGAPRDGRPTRPASPG